MRSLFTSFLLAIAATGFSQPIFIPYRTGNLFGLSNEQGKIIVTPAYDRVTWIQGSWFRTRSQVELKDTLEYAPGKFFIRNDKAKLSGLIYNGKVILKDEPFDDYEIVAHKCIVAVCERRATNFTKEQFKKYAGGEERRKFYSLFNLAGKNLYPENFKRIQKIDTTGISSKDKKTARYILFSGIDFDNKYSLFVFDADQQQITEWLLKDATKLQPDRRRMPDRQIIFDITDKNYSQSTQLLDYSGGKFVLKPYSSNKNTSEGQSRGNGHGKIEDVEVVELTEGNYMSVEAPPAPDRESGPRPTPKFNAYHQLIKDTLFYVTGHQSRKALALPAGTKIIFKEPRGTNQYQPVMVRFQNKFHILNEETPGAIAYDSLIYFGKYFLAWKNINGRSKAGVINSNDSIVVPFEYDSLYAGIRYFELKDMNPAGKSNYQPVLTEADSKYDYNKKNPYSRSMANFLTVFANGKAGIINLKHEIIIPLAYELIAQNNLQHSRPQVDEFILLKQNGRYGLTHLKYNNTGKQYKMEQTVAPVFSYIPGFYYYNYFGVKDFMLIGLYDDNYEFKGFASEKGVTYFKD